MADALLQSYEKNEAESFEVARKDFGGRIGLSNCILELLNQIVCDGHEISGGEIL